MTPPVPHTNELRSFAKMMAYLEGSLSEEERLQMQALLKEDETFKDQMDELHAAWMLNPNLREEARALHDSMPHVLKKASDSYESPPNPARQRRRMLFTQLFAAAAAILLIVNFVPGLFVSPVNLERPDMIAQEVGLYEERYSEMGTRSREDSIARAFHAYSESSYPEAIGLMSALIDTANQDRVMREMTMCLAVSYLMDQQPAQAMPYLGLAEHFAENAYKKEARWYRALALLGLDRKEEAKPLLEQILSETKDKTKIKTAKNIPEAARQLIALGEKFKVLRENPRFDFVSYYEGKMKLPFVAAE